MCGQKRVVRAPDRVSAAEGEIMKSIAPLFTRWKSWTAAAALVVALGLVAPVPSGAGPRGSGMPPAGASETDRAETVIKDLYTRLGITDKQEKQWNKVAQVMRENAKAMDGLIKTRMEKARSMNAVEDLKSYSDITDAQAAGLKKFIPAFEALYASLSEAQKKEADAAFKAPGPQQKPRRR